jgi:signal transduction histidine kinase
MIPPFAAEAEPMALIVRKPWLPLLLMLVAVAVVMALSEATFRRAQLSLDELAAIGSAHGATGGPPQRLVEAARAHRAELQRMLDLGRVSVPLLGALALLAGAVLLRQSRALQRQEDAREGRAQAAQDRLEAEVAQRTAQLTELTHHLQTAREDERARLARDLHDELGALLTSAKLDVARIRSRLAGIAPEAQERLAHLTMLLDSVIAVKRRITEDLRPSSLDHLGLLVTLEILAREFGERSGIAVALDLRPVPLAPAAELVAYRLVQEAVTNIAKYAQARRVWITLAEGGGGVELTVRDDGIGFDVAAMPRSGYGLVGMRFRVEAEHGTLAVLSAPGQGTRIVMTLPAASAADAAASAG